MTDNILALALQVQQGPWTRGDLSYKILQLWHITQPPEQGDCWTPKNKNQPLYSVLKKGITRKKKKIFSASSRSHVVKQNHGPSWWLTLTDEQRGFVHGPTNNLVEP